MGAGHGYGSSGGALSVCLRQQIVQYGSMGETMAAAAYVMDAEEGQTDAAFLGENLNTLKAESGSVCLPHQILAVRQIPAGS